MIHAAGLRKSFGQLVAVADVSFDVHAGEIFGLLGPNGAGKSTTIHMLCGLLRPDAGTITVAGQSDPTRSDVRARIGIAPQSLSLYDQLTAEENLRFFGRLYGLAGATLRQRVDHALEFVELTDRRRSRVRTFSGGMKRRLNLACALVHDPRVILLDEPTVGVDPQSRNHLFQRIEQLRAEGRTILYTTHYMEEAQRLCDRVAIIDHGKLLAIDTVDGLITAHGGRSLILAEFERPPTDLGTLPGRLDGLHWRMESERPLEDVGRLAGGGAALRTLNVTRPDLESVFLNLTGRSLRDA
ncbi:MAG: ABC transporter ATP-binding protein [Phycisphaerales bacterium]|nr:ABC transporter ATP-binding protein [Phycisphaerales bacterium]